MTTLDAGKVNQLIEEITREVLLRPATEITAVDLAIVQGTWAGPDESWPERTADAMREARR